LNVWEDNVAAGSEGAGFWFELRKRGARAHLFDLDPKTASLGRFKNNVAHSNAEKGFRTYPSGYLPDAQQVFENLKAYRNGGAGVFLHITRNVKIDGLLAADNKHVGVDIDRADAITISDSTIIGASDSYVELMNTQGVGGVCHQDRLHGIELHTWKHDPDERGATIIENVTFQGFDNNMVCPNGSIPLHLDQNTRTTQFDAYTSIAGVSVVPYLTDPIDFCDASNATVVNVYISDLDGSLSLFSTASPSTLISLHPIMQAFVDPAQCKDNKRRCYTYCNNTCFRTARFSIDPANTENHKLKVCKQGDSPSCIEILGYCKNQDTFTKRVFLAHLPRGSYDVVLLDRFGSATWPAFVDVHLEVALCPTAFSDDDIHLTVPKPASDDCNQLVRNGRMEKSDVEAKHWLSRFGSLLLAVGKGVDGSNALSGTGFDADTTFVQFIDTRCLKMRKGRFYELSADIKMTFSNDNPWICNPSKMVCPEIGVYTNEHGYFTVATTVLDPEAAGVDGFQRAFGFFLVEEHMVSATDIMLFVRSNVDDRIMYVDNVSMTLVPKEQKFCKNVILHSDMENEDWLKVWEIEGSGLLREIQGPVGANQTEAALRFGDRRTFSDALSYTGWRDVETACFTPGSTWKVVGQFQLYSKNTHRPEECNLAKDCPAVRLIIKDASRERIFIDKVREYTKSTWTANAFNRFEAKFTLPSDTEWSGEVGKIVLQILDFPVELDLIVGSIAMKPTILN